MLTDEQRTKIGDLVREVGGQVAEADPGKDGLKAAEAVVGECEHHCELLGGRLVDA